ncbi:MAG: hypothetical protein BIFFINMI_02854 [Phycisphaerae bacterium]|nr:hypothetical protein [Phycisphaerae bacterium]
MRPTRRTVRRLVIALMIAAGPLPWAAVFGAGLYLRSPLYHARVERELSAFFHLPTRVGQITPLSLRQRLLTDVEIFLPDAAGQPRLDARIASCKLARWVSSDQPGMHDLEIYGGRLDLSPASWAKGDFDQMEASLRHDYRRVRLNEVRIFSSAVRWGREDFELLLGGAGGTITFVGGDEEPDGLADLSATTLNGTPADVHITALFDPLTERSLADAHANGLVRRFDLDTGKQAIPLAQFRLDPLMDGPVDRGRFRGRLEYVARRPGQVERFTLRDAQLTDVDLSQVTRPLPGGPIPGTLNLDVRELSVEDGCVARLHFAGDLIELDLPAALRAARAPLRLDGRVTLHVDDFDLAPGPIRSLKVTGRGGPFDLAQLSALWPDRPGGGLVHGQADLQLAKLLITDGRLTALEADITAPPSADLKGQTIDRSLLSGLYEKMTGGPLKADLPEQVAWRKLGLHVADDGPVSLRLIGIGGVGGAAAITLLVPKRLPYVGMTDIPIDVPAPANPIAITELADLIARPFEPIPLLSVSRQIRERLTSAPTTQPDHH